MDNIWRKEPGHKKKKEVPLAFTLKREIWGSPLLKSHIQAYKVGER